MTYEMHYTGIGYPSMAEIEADAKKRGFTHSYWASEYGYSGMYNGDTVVVYTSTEEMPEGMRRDAERFGKRIAHPARKPELNRGKTYAIYNDGWNFESDNYKEAVEELIRQGDGFIAVVNDNTGDIEEEIYYRDIA